MAAIQLKDVVRIIRSGEWCAISVVQCDMAKKTAGKILVLPKARIARKQPMEAAGTAIQGSTDSRKPANHNQHFTMNVELPNHQIKKIHPPLVFEINGQKVI